MNIVGYYGLLQAFADALKLLLKEYVSPTQANIVLFFLGPIITLVFSLLGYAVIPYGLGLYISDFSLGILYILAVSSLSTYGILLAGWSANSKYAFLGSKWPSKNLNFYLKQTISEKFIKWKIFSLLGTLCVTPYIFKYLKILRKNMRGSKVKILSKINNSQVTKAFNSWVGTSETIRLLSIYYNNNNFKNYIFLGFNLFIKYLLNPVSRFYIFKNNIYIRSYIWVNHLQNPGSKNKNWNQWLAGLIDGDGSFYLTKNGYASLEITMDIKDEHALQIIKNIYGGSIKNISGLKALRYSLRHKQGFLALVKDVNGEIRNSYKLMQLNKICIKYGIVLVYPEKLKYENGWFSGFFDANGSVTLNSNNGQLAITLTQKTSEVLQPLIDLYGGSIYIDRTSNNFKWYISNKEGILKLIEYFKKYPSRSLKKNRLHLIPICYELKKIGAYKASENKPLLAKSWKLFNNKWNKYESF
jgi:NADH dehydrogenase/LAGLIDADG DNA endonuclease family protein